MANEAIKLKNELSIKFRMLAKAPLLVKESLGKNADSDNEIAWLLKDGGRGEGKPYIPGSTLKGLFREKFTSIYYDCLKFDQDKIEKSAMYENIFDGHQEEMEKLVNSGEIKTEEVYEKSLETEKLFGSKVLKGRFWSGDALMEGEYDPQNKKTRSITPIDRFTGGAVVPLLFEYVDNDFIFEMRIKNITKDELKYLMFIIRDSQNGEIRVGSSKTRGFGEVELVIESLTFGDYKEQNESFSMEKFSAVDEQNSVKIGENYLLKTYHLEEKYREINGENPFVQHLVGGRN
jgi:CRISPR/Cas system CSM-associated protein Csm3 (group 7 of RAMP superfamily)